MTPLLLENPQIFKKNHISNITPRDLQARLWVTSSSKMNCFNFYLSSVFMASKTNPNSPWWVKLLYFQFHRQHVHFFFRFLMCDFDFPIKCDLMVMGQQISGLFHELKLVEGCEVMLCHNLDVGDGLHNGAQGGSVCRLETKNDNKVDASPSNNQEYHNGANHFTNGIAFPIHPFPQS